MIISYLRSLLGFPSLTHHDHDHYVTILIDDSTEVVGRKNLLYESTRAYLFSKTNPRIHVGEYEFSDLYQGVGLKWRILRNKNSIGKESFELRFDGKHKDLVFNSYIPFVESKAKEIKSKKRTLEMHTYFQCSRNIYWETTRLDHVSTFDTIFMKDELKRGLIKDLDRFTRRKDFYKRVGSPWTRSYLLHGLPGSGKTSLVAAMANYLNFDVYKLPVTQVMKSDFNPQRLCREVMDCSILLVEDIDCSVEGFKTLASKYLDLSDDNHRLYPDIKRLIDGQVVTPGQVIEELRKNQDVDVALEGLVSSLEMKEFDTIK